MFRGCFIFLLTLVFIICSVIFGSIYFYTNGISAVSNFIVNRLPTSLDKEVGREVRKQILNRAPIDEAKTALLKEFFNELHYNSKTKVYVLNVEEFNAFALPDNSIFVFDKVLDEVNSYSELAALLGHEYSHIKYRHGMKTLAHSLSRELLTELLSNGNSHDNFIRHSSELLVLSNSREFETDADLGGLELLREQHIDQNGMVSLFKTMQALPQTAHNETPTYLSSHPDIEDRLEKVEEVIKESSASNTTHSKLETIFADLKSKN